MRNHYFISFFYVR